jgi:hypothetical protein
MVLKDSTGAVIDVPTGEAEFHKAMAAPEPSGSTSGGAGAQVPAPPRVDPEAPYGRKVDGTPKGGPGGRPPKHADKARVTTAPATGPAGETRDYTPDLVGLSKSLYVVMAMIPPTQAQAALWRAAAPAMVPAWNEAAQQNEQVRAALEWLSGPGTWPVAVAAATIPFTLQSIALWRGGPNSELHKMLTEATHADLQRMAQEQEAMMRDIGFETAAA